MIFEILPKTPNFQNVTEPKVPNQFSNLKKYQKVNQFPKSVELTRKDLLVERIQQMQEIHHGGTNFNFLPLTLTLPKERHFL